MHGPLPTQPLQTHAYAGSLVEHNSGNCASRPHGHAHQHVVTGDPRTTPPASESNTDIEKC
eukprot:35927-Eustigmatos_ZCMA.PRE.1